MRVALAQLLSGYDPAANLALVREQVDAAAAEGATLVVFPEATMCAFGGDLAAVAEPVDGPWAGAVRASAAAAGVTVVVGMFTPGQDGRVRNTLLVTGPALERTYDKIHLYDAFGAHESESVEAGDEVVTFELDGTTVGVATCYDVRFPQLFTALADRGAQVVTVSASWGDGPGKRAQWDLLVRARALDCTSVVLACGQALPAAAGVEVSGSAPRGVGGSAVVSPLGVVLAGLDEAPSLLVTDLDLAEVDRVRAALPVLANRRSFP